MGTGAVFVSVCRDLAQFIVDEVSRFGVASDWFIVARLVGVTAARVRLVAWLVTGLVTFPFTVIVRVSSALLIGLRPITGVTGLTAVTGLVT